MRSMFAGRARVQKVFVGSSLAKQAFKKECDINAIMARYEKNGLISHVNRFQGQYGDFTDPPGYQDALNKVISAQDMFMTLPAKVRARFGNDPGEFLEFVQDPRNSDELVKLGLAKYPEPEKPMEVVVKEMPAAPESGSGKD